MEFTPWDPRHLAFGFVTDLSLGGVFVQAVFSLPCGSHVVLRMWKCSWAEEVVAAGIVRWLHSGGMGVQFHGMTADGRAALHHMVARARFAELAGC